MDKLLSVADVQEYLHLGRTTTYKLVSQTGFPKIVIGKKILIPEQEFERYIKDHMYSKILL